MNQLVEAHLERVRAAISDEIITYSQWIVDNTRLKGKNYSFKDHEYQKEILDDPHPKKVARKPSQVGATEFNLRRALAFLNVNAGTKLSYVLPSAVFARKVMKMRLDPIIKASPRLREALEKGSDSTELKQFGESFFLSQGASSTSSTNVLAVDLDAVVVDEIDGCDDHDVINQLISRLTHSSFQDEFFLSTPTVSRYGISGKFDSSIQFEHMQKCNRCNHWFVPNYFKDVVLPGFHDPLEIVTYQNKRCVEDFDLTKAYLCCPKCRRQVDTMDPRSRQFVCVNPDSNAEFHGYQINPFSVPRIITPGSLILRSTKYSRVSDFWNDGLGLPHDSTESGFSIDEIETFFHPTKMFPTGTKPPYTVLGMDMGGTCATLVGYPHYSDGLRIIHAELVPLHRVRERYSELCGMFNSICSVMDAFPYTDIVLYLQAKFGTLWAAVFSNKKGLALYDVRESGDEDDGKAMSMVRGIDVARDRVLDLVVSSLRSGAISFDPTEHKTLITEHLMSLKRIRIKDADGEEKFSWKKTDGMDHFFFTLCYVFLASCIGGDSGVASSGFPVISKFKNKSL